MSNGISRQRTAKARSTRPIDAPTASDTRWDTTSTAAEPGEMSEAMTRMANEMDVLRARYLQALTDLDMARSNALPAAPGSSISRRAALGEALLSIGAKVGARSTIVPAPEEPTLPNHDDQLQAQYASAAYVIRTEIEDARTEATRIVGLARETAHQVRRDAAREAAQNLELADAQARAQRDAAQRTADEILRQAYDLAARVERDHEFHARQDARRTDEWHADEWRTQEWHADSQRHDAWASDGHYDDIDHRDIDHRDIDRRDIDHRDIDHRDINHREHHYGDVAGDYTDPMDGWSDESRGWFQSAPDHFEPAAWDDRSDNEPRHEDARDARDHRPEREYAHAAPRAAAAEHRPRYRDVEPRQGQVLPRIMQELRTEGRIAQPDASGPRARGRSRSDAGPRRADTGTRRRVPPVRQPRATSDRPTPQEPSRQQHEAQRNRPDAAPPTHLAHTTRSEPIVTIDDLERPGQERTFEALWHSTDPDPLHDSMEHYFTHKLPLEGPVRF